MLIRLRRRVDESVETAIQRIVSGPGWKWKALVAVLGLSLLRAFPSYDALGTPFVEMTWRSALHKVDDPMAETTRLYPPESHESKLTFRLTVPVLAHVLHLRRTGLLIFSALTGVLLLYSLLGVAYAVTASKKAALLVCLATACTWPGETAFHELRGGYYDAVALCLLLLALSAKSPLLTSLWVFLAAWADERALIASSFVFLFAIAEASRAGMRSLLAAKPAAIVIAWIAYFSTRLYLTAGRSLFVATGDIGLPVLREQTNVIPLGLWTGLGGSWIFVACGVLALFAQKRYLMAAGFCGALGATIGVALSVIDVTRSMAYCLPAVFVGMSLLSRSEPVEEIERLAALGAAISFVVPTYYVQGSTGLWWLYPLPVQIVRWLLP